MESSPRFTNKVQYVRVLLMEFRPRFTNGVQSAFTTQSSPVRVLPYGISFTINGV